MTADVAFVDVQDNVEACPEKIAAGLATNVAVIKEFTVTVTVARSSGPFGPVADAV
jgi:hypothetical protein